MKLKKWELALIAALLFTFILGAGLRREQTDLSEKLIRLHVVANSDSEADQALKLKVRDGILKEVGRLLEGVTDRGEAVRLIEENLDTVTAGRGTRAPKRLRLRGNGDDCRRGVPTRNTRHFRCRPESIRRCAS
jgi:hypothetical protein